MPGLGRVLESTALSQAQDLDRGSAVGPAGSMVARLSYRAAAARAIVADPAEGLERSMEKLAERRDRRASARYEADPQWERRLHELRGT